MNPTPQLKPLIFSQALIFLAFYGIFLLCFVLTPLWNSLSGLPQKGVMLASTSGLGMLWAWLAIGGRLGDSRGLKLPKWRVVGWFLFILALVGMLEFRAWASAIPWRGDEDFHVAFASHLADLLGSYWHYPIILTVFLAWASRCNVVNTTVLVAAIGMLMLATWAGYRAHLDIYEMLRYPILIKYLTAAPVYFLGCFPSFPYPELPYRLLPLLSGAGLAWLGFRFLAPHSLPIRLGAAFIIATLPLVRYYDTLFYLEMPAVLCMALVCFQSGSLLRYEFRDLMQLPGWYALLLIGFIKETSLPFLAAFLLCRFVFRITPISKHSFRRDLWLQEVSVYFCVVFPLALYLFYRGQLGIFRGYHPHPANLADLSLFLILLQSWWDSFGLLLPTALVGVLVTLCRRGWRCAEIIFPSVAFSFIAAFHFLDSPLYTGYSRVNIFIMPGINKLARPAGRGGGYRNHPINIWVLGKIVSGNIFNYTQKIY
jgi:hypothetical protein